MKKKKKMKTKTKLIASLEIAVVLCSVFLVCLPGIAAEQNQEMQKASASEVMTASKDDYVLDIYGNANEDDAIDMRDLTYVKLIFFGKKPETELADAKYDGKINPLDFIQIKLIIVGKEKELTLIDAADRIVTVKKPIERVVILNSQTVEAMRSIKATDKIVGVDKWTIQDQVFFPEFSDYTNVGGSVWSPDYEEILNCDPDVVFLYAAVTMAVTCEKVQNKLKELDPSITVIRLDCFKQASFVDEIAKLGYILDKEEEAEEFIDFYEGFMNSIKGGAEGLSEEDKIRVYIESRWGDRYRAGAIGTDIHELVLAAGGKNIFGDLEGYVDVDPEEVIMQNPEIIVKMAHPGGYDMDVGDTAELEAVRKEILDRAELEKVAAVKDGKVYIIAYLIYAGGRHFVAVGYTAKWFYPDLFSDLDPKAAHQEYLTRFQGLNIDLDEKGVYVYHPEEHPDGH